MIILKCPICGETPDQSQREAWSGSHGYFGNYYYVMECKACGITPPITVDDIYMTPVMAKKKLISEWNIQARKIEKYLMHKEAKR